VRRLGTAFGGDVRVPDEEIDLFAKSLGESVGALAEASGVLARIK
jgi:hypothetical protein